MSKVISKIKSLWRDLTDKESRDEYVAARIASDLSHQIYAMREQRGWTQGELAERCGQTNGQSWVSRLESYCEPITIKTLLKIASAYDVGLSVKFVPFSQLANESVTERLDRDIPAFGQDNVTDCHPALKLSVIVPPSPSRGSYSLAATSRRTLPRDNSFQMTTSDKGRLLERVDA